MTEQTLILVQNAVEKVNSQAREFNGSFTHEQVVSEMEFDLLELTQLETLDAKNKIPFFAEFVAELNEKDLRWYPN